jgi:hypothetical protein
MQLLIECTTEDQDALLHDFCIFTCERLEIGNPPSFTFVEHTGFTSFGSYTPSEEAIIVATEGRHTSDILRTLGHELVHHKQLSEGDNEMTLEELEYEANAVAGMLMRDYNKLHPEMFGLAEPIEPGPGTIGDSQGAAFPDPTRPSGPIEFAEESMSKKATHVGTCVNSFDRGSGECTVPHLPYRDASHFATGVENSHKVSKEHFLKHVTVPKHLDSLINKRTTEFLHDKDHGVHMLHDQHKDVHHFFTEEMTAGAGDVAGIGIGPQGEPGVTPKKKKTLKMFRRKLMNPVSSFRSNIFDHDRPGHRRKLLEYNKIIKDTIIEAQKKLTSGKYPR